MSRSHIIKGHICHAPEAGRLEIRENAFVVCEDGICRGIFDEVPEKYRGLEIADCTGKLVLPGLVDLHIHAPQYAYRGTGMDYELLDWLYKVAFPEEIRYEDAEYAAKAYEIFARKMKRSATTRAVIFGTIHTDATLILADWMEKSGLVSFVGKVSMDRDAMPELTEKSA
ncbi:MAG: amidohydrolase family protein, partial [Clostridia bacterium]